MRQRLTTLLVTVLTVFFASAQTLRIGKGRVELTAYPASGPDATAVIVCPGGSYFWHDMVSEGDSVGHWLQRQGICAFVLRYRTAYVPAFITHFRLIFRGNRYPDPQNDLREALRYVRAHATEYRVSPEKIGVMGFSAGGHLVMSSVELFPREEWPAFIVPVYPVVTMVEPWVHKRSRRGLLGDSRTGNRQLRDSLSLEKHIPDGCPPVFLVNCEDDPIVDFHNSVVLDSALTARKVPHVYLRYATGGHGFGANCRKGSAECRTWRRHFLTWLRSLNL